jgi:hypothetical protein
MLSLPAGAAGFSRLEFQSLKEKVNSPGSQHTVCESSSKSAPV